MAHRNHGNHRNSLAGEEGFKLSRRNKGNHRKILADEEGFKCPAERKEIKEIASQARMGVKGMQEVIQDWYQLTLKNGR